MSSFNCHFFSRYGCRHVGTGSKQIWFQSSFLWQQLWPIKGELVGRPHPYHLKAGNTKNISKVDIKPLTFIEVPDLVLICTTKKKKKME